MATTTETTIICEHCGEGLPLSVIREHMSANQGNPTTQRRSQGFRTMSDEERAKAFRQPFCPNCLARPGHQTRGEAYDCVQKHDGLEFMGYMSAKLRAALDAPAETEEGTHTIWTAGEDCTLRVHVLSREGKAYKVTRWNSTKRGRPIEVLLSPRHGTTAWFTLTDVRLVEDYDPDQVDQNA